MLKKNLILFSILTIMLLILSGCSVNNENENNDITNDLQEKVQNEVQNNENVANESSQESKTDIKLPEKEALDIGYDLYSYGLYPQYYDEETSKFYLGKSRAEEKYEESIEFDEYYLGYKFGSNDDVENYFTEKRIKELELQEAPYRLKNIDGVWYLGQPGVGSDFSYLGNVLTIKSLEENKIVFTSTEYLSEDYGQNGDSDFEKYKDKKLYEYIDEIKTKYKFETEEYDFVIVKENGNWKIDEQSIAHY